MQYNVLPVRDMSHIKDIQIAQSNIIYRLGIGISKIYISKIKIPISYTDVILCFLFLEQLVINTINPIDKKKNEKREP